jgi:hypothetical protein
MENLTTSSPSPPCKGGINPSIYPANRIGTIEFPINKENRGGNDPLKNNRKTEISHHSTKSTVDGAENNLPSLSTNKYGRKLDYFTYINIVLNVSLQ